jgi:hypothetical protein
MTTDGEVLGTEPLLSQEQLDWLHEFKPLVRQEKKQSEPELEVEPEPEPEPESELINQPGNWDFMISYTQRNAVSETLAVKISGELRKRGKTVWLDVEMDERDETAMEEGVKNSQCVIAIVSGPVMDPENPDVKPEANAYFRRPFCLSELRWAMDAEVSILPVVAAEDKGKISEFCADIPEDLARLKGVDWKHIDRKDAEYFEVGMRRIMQNSAIAASKSPADEMVNCIRSVKEHITELTAGGGALNSSRAWDYCKLPPEKLCLRPPPISGNPRASSISSTSRTSRDDETLGKTISSAADGGEAGGVTFDRQAADSERKHNERLRQRCIPMLHYLGETLDREYAKAGGAHWGSEDRRTKMWFVALTRSRVYVIVTCVGIMCLATIAKAVSCSQDLFDTC